MTNVVLNWCQNAGGKFERVVKRGTHTCCNWSERITSFVMFDGIADSWWCAISRSKFKVSSIIEFLWSF